jgi:acetyltransferase-like isoleucine patch superfamily enzyme
MLKHFKLYLKQKISKFPFLAMFFVRLYFSILGFLGYFYRYKYFFSCKIANSARVIGWKSIKLGKNVVICNRTWLNVNHRNGKHISKAIQIGSNSFIGENNFFTSGLCIIVGDYTLTASNCSFIGASHNVDNVNSPYLTTGVYDTNVIKIGVNCFFGYDSSVVGDVCIGHGSIIGAKAVVINDVPPFSMVVGNPARVVKRFDFDSLAWVKGEVDEKLIPSEEEYLKLLKDKNKYILMPYILAANKFSSII